jgi:Leucine-rich repeat (LRR) protein
MIQKFENLSSIRISYSDIKDESLKLLAGCNLYGLSLEYCGLKDISGLSDLVGVSDLRLGGNQIEDISVLKSFTQISYCLDLRNNKIRDFSPLESIRLSSL